MSLTLYFLLCTKCGKNARLLLLLLDGLTLTSGQQNKY
jgi:hypothetical protein